MSDDVKPDAAPPVGGQPNPQPSESDLEAKFTKLLNERVSGIQSAFEKKLNEFMDRVARQPVSDPDDSGAPTRPFGTLSPSERQITLREENVTRREMEFAKRTIASEYNIPEDKLTGNTEMELRISAMSQRILEKEAPKEEPKGDDVKDTPGQPLGYTPITGRSGATIPGSMLSPEGMIQTGVGDQLKNLKSKV